MADKSIRELPAAANVLPADLFVLEQTNTAKKLTGQVLIHDLAAALDGHGGINNVTKTGTTGIVDTYTITFADGTATTFAVSNGRGVSGIAKTGTSGLVDTYTITYNDGSTSTFEVHNGNGVTGVDKTSRGLIDTYTMRFADGDPFVFALQNGRGIKSVSKTSEGLTDIYTVTYNDDSVETFTVDNGEKGDPGDNAYTWIKYASEDPTAGAASIGDVPDKWLGIYTGHSEDAPTDPSEYRWYLIKGAVGDTGDKGDPGDTYQTKITYGVSDSPSVYPTVWYTSITSAPISSGSYVWTRVQYVGDAGTVVNTAYSVSHIGENGTGAGTVKTVTFGGTTYGDVAGDVTIPMPSPADVGAIAEPEAKGGGQFLQWDAFAGKWVAATPTGSVTTVNNVGVAPGTTNIQLSAEDVGARPDNWLPTPDQIGAVPQAGYVPAINNDILDNGWMRVNQRGRTSYSNEYCVDRWIAGSAVSVNVVNVSSPHTDTGLLSITAGVANASFSQRIPLERVNQLIGKTVTLSVMVHSSTGYYVKSGTFVFTSSTDNRITVNDNWWIGIYSTGGTMAVRLLSRTAGANIGIRAMKLELGSVSTLESDVEPDYAAELLKCQRYYYQTWQGGLDQISPTDCIAVVGTGFGSIPGAIRYPVEMRAAPTIVVYCHDKTANAVRDWASSETITGVTTNYVGKKTAAIRRSSGNFAAKTYAFHYTATADL